MSIIKDFFGNITLIESSILLVLGVIGVYSYTPHLRENVKDDRYFVTRIGRRFMTWPVKRSMEVVEGDLKKENVSYILIFSGLIFIVELIILTMIK